MTDDPAGWADVLVTHRAELVRAAQARLHGRSDAEDVVHEVAARVLGGGRPAWQVTAPMAYLRRAVANECTSRWRRRGRDVLVDTVPDRPMDGSVEDCLNRILLHGVLAELTERQRRVITLSVLNDRADGEIAAALGVTEVTVRTTRRRALARLRLLLTEAATKPAPAPAPAVAVGYPPPAAPPGRAAGRRTATKPANWSTAA
jgi:RNA polymerase sigma factor (sigma-70 family)